MTALTQQQDENWKTYDIMRLTLTTLTLIVAVTNLGQGGEKKQTLPEYNAHIGETARVTDKVCEVSPRHWGGLHIGLGDCGPGGKNVPFYAITYSDVIPGPKLDFEKLKGSVVTVTGKIKEYGHTGTASIDVKLTSQIVPHPH